MESESGAWEAGASAWVSFARDDSKKAHDAAICELLPPPAGLTLDVGCGEGRLTRMLKLLGYETIGFDRSEALVDEARRADPDSRYEVAAIDSLPVPDGEAALAVCVNVLPHVAELDDALHELARVLRPDGSLVLGLLHPVMLAGVYDEETDSLRVSRYFDAQPEAVPLGDVQVHHHHRTLEGYLRALFSAGFALDDLREVAGPTGTLPRYLDLRLRCR